MFILVIGMERLNNINECGDGETEYATALKAVARKGVWVRFPLSAPLFKLKGVI